MPSYLDWVTTKSEIIPEWAWGCVVSTVAIPVGLALFRKIFSLDHRGRLYKDVLSEIYWYKKNPSLAHYEEKMLDFSKDYLACQLDLTRYCITFNKNAVTKTSFTFRIFSKKTLMPTPTEISDLFSRRQLDSLGDKTEQLSQLIVRNRNEAIAKALLT